MSRGIPGAGIFVGTEDRNASNSSTVQCHENSETAAGIIFLVAGLGIGTNIMVMFLIIARRNLRR